MRGAAAVYLAAESQAARVGFGEPAAPVAIRMVVRKGGAISVYLSKCLKTCLFICLSVYLYLHAMQYDIYNTYIYTYMHMYIHLCM